MVLISRDFTISLPPKIPAFYFLSRFKLKPLFKVYIINKMEITKEENNKRKNCLLKAHYWFGSVELKKILKDNYDYYIDYENTLFYVYEKEVILK